MCSEITLECEVGWRNEITVYVNPVQCGILPMMARNLTAVLAKPTSFPHLLPSNGYLAFLRIWDTTHVKDRMITEVKKHWSTLESPRPSKRIAE